MSEHTINSASSDSFIRENTETREIQTKKDLPKYYGKDKLVLLVKDPYWLHSYWTIGEQKWNDIRSLLSEKDLEDSKIILRVYNVTGIEFSGENANSYFDITIGSENQNWYINVKNPDNEYIVEYGVAVPDGRFIMMLRSNMVRTPLDSFYTGPDVPEQEYNKEMRENMKKIYAVSGEAALKGEGASSHSIMEHIMDRIEREMNVSSHTVSSFSSAYLASSGNEDTEKKFWLVADTELIVYGATEPDAYLTIQGEPVPLREDGTFTLRYSLPDGEQIIPIVAENNDRDDKKSIEFTVSRKTRTEL